jgi:hypothetical protein
VIVVFDLRVWQKKFFFLPIMSKITRLFYTSSSDKTVINILNGNDYINITDGLKK